MLERVFPDSDCDLRFIRRRNVSQSLVVVLFPHPRDRHRSVLRLPMELDGFPGIDECLYLATDICWRHSEYVEFFVFWIDLQEHSCAFG